MYSLMTLQQRNSIVSYVTIANFVLIIGAVWQQAQWQKDVENKIENLETHAEDKVLHMPIEKQIQLYVPRIEIDGRLRGIENSLQEIKADLKKNLNK